MTEKRYGMSNETGAFIDKQIDKEYTDDEIIDLLNEQHKRIEYLENLPSERLELLKQAKIKEMDLKEENEQLKHEINYLQNRLDDYVCVAKENKDLKEENLELSQKILKGLFEDENDELRKENKKLKKELQWCRMTVDGLKGDV